jgi:hypothetical protein
MWNTKHKPRWTMLPLIFIDIPSANAAADELATCCRADGEISYASEDLDEYSNLRDIVVAKREDIEKIWKEGKWPTDPEITSKLAARVVVVEIKGCGHHVRSRSFQRWRVGEVRAWLVRRETT